MSSSTLVRRIGVLEALTQRYGDDGEYVADIGGDDACYWIDGQEVSRHEWMQRVPCGPFAVDLGEEGGDER